MRFILFILSFIQVANAAVLNECVVLESGATITATSNSAISNLAPGRLKQLRNFTGTLSATNNSGTTPTMAVVIQTCESQDTATCYDTAIAFTSCTTGSCSERIDLAENTNNVFSHFRVKHTLGGTSPNYTVTVRICHN